MNSFVTLTYDERCLPKGGTLSVRDVQSWLKRLRFRLGEHKVRYFLVGEYGEYPNMRPHYHLALFGYPPCSNPALAQVNRNKRPEPKNCTCPSCLLIGETWNQGLITNDVLNKDSAAYIAGYVVKKLTSPDSDKNMEYRKSKNMLLGDRHPEFARMSLKPGIGAAAMLDVANLLTTEVGCNVYEATGDVPMVFNHAGRVLPLGRYLRSKIRYYYGSADTSTPKEAMRVWKEKMRDMFTTDKGTFDEKKWRSELQKEKQKIVNLESRLKIYSKKRTI